MEPSSSELGMTCGNDGPWTWLVEVVEDQSDLIHQMASHENVHGKKKIQHLDAKVEARIL